MTIAPDIATDLDHPARRVPAPARERRAPRSCSSRSSAGVSGDTHSSAPARVSATSTRPRPAASRSSATSRTTTPHGWSRPSRCRRRAPACPRAASSSPISSCASTTSSAPQRCSRGDPDEIARPRTGPGRRRRATAARRADARLPAERLRARRPRRKEYIRAATRSRSSSRSVPSGRPLRRALELYRALRRVNPSPYLFLLELDDLALIGSSPETLVKCEGPREPEPDRRDDPRGAR